MGTRVRHLFFYALPPGKRLVGTAALTRRFVGEEAGQPVASTSTLAGPLVVSFEEPRGASTAGTQRDMQAFMVRHYFCPF